MLAGAMTIRIRAGAHHGRHVSASSIYLFTSHTRVINEADQVSEMQVGLLRGSQREKIPEADRSEYTREDCLHDASITDSSLRGQVDTLLNQRIARHGF